MLKKLFFKALEKWTFSNGQFLADILYRKEFWDKFKYHVCVFLNLEYSFNSGPIIPRLFYNLLEVK